MLRWSDFERQVPEFAALTRLFLEAGVHKTIATLTAGGSPRISGVEARFADGDLYLGMMPNSLKALDLRRDPRFALHSASIDPPEWLGDAKLSGWAIELGDTPSERESARRSGPKATHTSFGLILRECRLSAWASRPTTW